MASSHPSFHPRMIGRYEASRVLGQGAMGRVLLARDPVLNRDVAIKVLRDDLNIPPEVRDGLIARMRHEAQAAARVSHPNLVTLHDMGEDEGVGLYLVFEHVAGPNLKERLKSGRLPPMQAARLARELGGALAVAHLAGVLHRDVKPENVMLSPTGAKIADFGIAKIPDSTLTRTGSLVGTPAYCAPEALTSSTFSPESDQFSLGATLYEAVSGERAFPGEDAVGVATKIATEEPRPIARKCGLPDEVDVILLRAMSKDPSRRFASTAELGETLGTALEQGVRGSMPSMSALVPPLPAGAAAAAVAPPRDPTKLWIGGLTVAIVSGLVGYAASQGAPFFGASTKLPASVVVPVPTAAASPARPPASSTATATRTRTFPIPVSSAPPIIVGGRDAGAEPPVRDGGAEPPAAKDAGATPPVGSQ